MSQLLISQVLNSSGWLLAQSSNNSGGFPWIDILIVLVCVGGAVFAVCRSANRG